jgi:magnesium transporter
VEGRLRDEQVSLFLFKDVVLTFQETAGDLWDPIRQRLQKAGHSRLRVNGASYLVYAMLDSVVDHYFPILESYGDLLEEIEKEIFESSSVRVQQKVHLVKRELALLRRVAWPMREVITELQRDETAGISPTVKTYLRDVYDHTVQIMDIVETHREMAAGLNDLYMSAVSNRMNEVMKVLTIMASFFIPLTFVAGIYGMNFDYIPELKWRFGYVGFWGVCAAIAVGMGVFFQRRGWLGRRQ